MRSIDVVDDWFNGLSLTKHGKVLQRLQVESKFISAARRPGGVEEKECCCCCLALAHSIYMAAAVQRESSFLYFGA